MKLAIVYPAIVAIGFGLGLLAFSSDGKQQPAPEVPAAPSVQTNPVDSSAVAQWQAAQELRHAERADAFYVLAENLPYEQIETCLAELRLPLEVEIAGKLLARLAEHDPVRAMELADSLPLAERPHVTRRPYWALSPSRQWALKKGIMRVWMANDPESALSHAEAEIANRPSWSWNSKSTLRMALAALAKTDPDRMRQFADKYGIPAVEQIAYFPKSSLKEQLAELDHLSDEADRVQALAMTLRHWAREDPESTYRAVMAMPPGSDGIAVATGGGNYSGAQAMKLHLHAMGDGIDLTNWSKQELWWSEWGQPDGIQRWALNDPKAALDWMENVPATARDHFRAKAIVGASLTDPQLAIAELEALPDGYYEKAAQAIAKEWYPRDSEAALAWAGSIADPDLSEKLRTMMKP